MRSVRVAAGTAPRRRAVVRAAAAAMTRAVRSTRRVESEHYLDAIAAMCD